LDLDVPTQNRSNSGPPLSYIGVSARSTPLEIRERFARRWMAGFDGPIPEPHRGGHVVVSGCNRFDAYSLTSSPVTSPELACEVFNGYWDGSSEEIAQSLETQQGDEAIQHLFRVASGLDSVVIGETEILGQVRQAFEYTTARGPFESSLVQVFRCAMRVGRRPRSETEISRHAGSVPSAAIRLVQNTSSDIDRCRAMVA
jgi:glutamyl-tRNA reductase